MEFLCGLRVESLIQVQIVQAATKWKRMPLYNLSAKSVKASRISII